MLKLLGCICILAASGGMACSCVAGLKQKLRQTELLLDLLTAIEGEITYSRCPLPELLAHLARHTQPPYGKLLEEAGVRMEDSLEADIPVLWKQVCDAFRPQLDLPAEAYQVLLRVGEVFSYTSLEASLQLLGLGRKRLAAVAEGRYSEFAGKRKLYCCLCYMAGLFSIILLL